MKKNKHKLFLKIGFLIIFLLGAFYLAREVSVSPDIREWIGDYGYIALFSFAIISGFNLIFPLPAIALVPIGIAGGLDPWLSAIIISFGMTIGDSISYLVAKFGRELLSKHQFLTKNKLEKISKKHPTWPIIFLLFYASFVPLPNEIIVVPLTLLCYKAKQIIPAVFVGNLAFNLLVVAGILSLYF